MGFQPIGGGGGAVDLNAPRIPQTLGEINSTGLVARWLLDGTLTDQVSSLALTRSGTWNTTSYNVRWDSELNQYVPVFTGTNYYTFSPTGFPSGAAARTFCGWVKYRTATVAYAIPFMYGGSAAQSGFLWQLDGSSIVNFNSGSGFISSGINPHSDGVWHHLAATYNGSTVAVHIDGILQASGTQTLNTTLTYGAIGDWALGGYAHTGYVADIRCYSTALTAAQVLAIASFEA